MKDQANSFLSKYEQYYQNAREDMLKYIPPTAAKILELGCGSGKFSELLKTRYNAECWGVELNNEAAKEASARLHKVITTDILTCLDEIPDNYFDCIIMNDVLEHLVDPYSVLIGLRGKISPQGVIVLSVPNVRYWQNLVQLVLFGKWDYKESGILDNTHLRFFTYKSLLKMFRELGFTVLIQEGIKHRRTIAGTIIQIFCLCFFNIFADIRHFQFACVIKPCAAQKM